MSGEDFRIQPPLIAGGRGRRRFGGAGRSDPPQTPEELHEAAIQSEPMLRLTQARVVLADRDLLREDFPELQPEALALAASEIAEAPPSERRRLEEAAIDRWLLRNAALVSQAQAAQSIVNTEIPAGGPHVIAHRPSRYGRAVVASVGSGPGLLDLKGVGVRPGVTPEPRIHRDGLLPLDVLLHELLNQMLVEAVFRHAGLDVRGVGVYAVIDCGFEVRQRGAHSASELVLATPAAILVRRAHRRPRGQLDLPRLGSVEQAAALEVELVLRQYGVTSAGAIIELAGDADGHTLVGIGLKKDKIIYRSSGPGAQHLRSWCAGRPAVVLEGCNVQTTREVSAIPLRVDLVDFGHYGVRAAFQRPLLSAVCDVPLAWGGALCPEDAGFPQPDPALAIPPALWARRVTEPGIADELGLPRGIELSRAREHAMRLAARWRRRAITGAELQDALAGFVATATRHLGGASARPGGRDGEQGWTSA
jgi:hypothetical protein